MISSRAADIRRASSRSERPCRTWSFESGGDRDRVFDVNALPVSGNLLGERFAIGRMHEARNAGTDFVR
jgi:hypothetical protein